MAILEIAKVEEYILVGTTVKKVLLPTKDSSLDRCKFFWSANACSLDMQKRQCRM
jgi:hypothetical protein